ncbi:MAG TPA: hypothetical protein VFZ78_06155 [Flavisolibacter sp.]
MKKFLPAIVLVATVTAILVSGCQKSDVSDELTPQQEEEVAMFSLQAEAESQMVFNDVFDNVMGVSNEVGMGGTGIFGRMLNNLPVAMKVDSACFTVVKTHLNPPNIFPLKIVIDFGATGCTGQDGHTRYGKVITTYTGRLVWPGKSATTTFDGFKIDSISVEGTHVITNTTQPAGPLQFSVNVDDAKLSKPNGNYSMWDSHRVITQVEGGLTPDIHLDDVFIITGNAHGKIKRFTSLFIWESLITEPLRKKFTCPWITKGILKVWRQTLPATSPWVSVLNFGNGACDYLATLTINGVTHNIQLPH